MHLNDRVFRLSRRTAATFATVPAALLVMGLASGVAMAAPGDNITKECLQTSQGGSDWAGIEGFSPAFEALEPVPGQEETHLAFNVRNTCDVPATLTIYSQNWVVADGGTATVRGAIDGQKGQQVVIGPDKDASTQIVLQKKVLPQNVSTPVEYILGLPSAETEMGYEIKPGWGFILIEDDPGMAAPGAPTGLTLGAAEAEAGTPVRVSGVAEPGSAVTVTGGGATCTTAADGTTGAFSCELRITTPGDHPITASAKNAGGAGPASSAVTVKITPSTTGPADPDEGGGSGSLGSLGSMDLFGSLGG